MNNPKCFNCGHTARHGGDGCIEILDNGNYCSCPLEQPAVNMAHEIKQEQRADAIAHLTKLAAPARQYRAWNMPNSVSLQMLKVKEAVEAYNAISVYFGLAANR